MSKLIDLTGKKFGRLTVLRRGENEVMPCGATTPQWWCQCDCGSEPKLIRGKYLRDGRIVSCGCYHKEIINKAKKLNTYDLSGEFGIGYDHNNKTFYFDLEDYEHIKDYCWYVNNHGYVITKRDDQTIAMHRFIMNCPPDKYVDHIHGIKTITDNRKSNLRITTNQENTMNARLKSNNSSGVTGVDWCKNMNAWRARIKVNYKDIILGYFSDFDQAVSCRKEAEKKYFGEYAYDYSQQLNTEKGA